MNARTAFRGPGRAWLRLLALVGTAGVLTGQLGRALPLLDPLNATLPVLLPGLALLVALALRQRDRTAASIGLAGLVVGSVQLGAACLPASLFDRQAPVDAAKLRVLTLSTWHSNPHPQAIRELVETQQPDIALLQETDRNTAKVVAGLFPQFYRVRSCRARYCSLTILSRWPIRRIVLPARPGTPLPDILLAQVDAPGPIGMFRVIDVHLPRPNHRDATAFNRQLVQASLRFAGDPLIAAGDFNIATGSFSLNRFEKNTGLRRLEGFLPTYPAHARIPALIGIDHLFASRHWTSEGCRRAGAGGSDHYGIACLLSMPTRRQAAPLRH